LFVAFDETAHDTMCYFCWFVLQDEDDYTTWTTGLRWLIAHKYDLHRTYTNIDDALAR
jgi:hypothetical protein